MNADDLVLDCRDLRCPLPVIELAKHIGDVPVGGFLQKPFGLEDIERTLASVLAR